MVDALVLEASTSVCGFESHLPHQKKRAPKGAFFFCRPLRQGLPLRSMCGRNLRFPHTRPRSSRSEPSRIKEGTRKSAFFWFVPPASPRQPFPNPCRRAAHQSSSLFPLHSPHSGLPLPLPGSAREPPSAGGGGSVPRQQYGTAKHPFPPHGPACRAQAHSEPVPQSGTPQLFTLLYSLFSLPAPAFPSHFPGRPENRSPQGLTFALLYATIVIQH